MNCPSCGAPMKLKPDMDSFKCEYCQSVYLPEKDDDGVRVLGEPSDQTCAVCNLPLMQAAIDKFRILYCNQCHGMLIPMQEFQVLIDDLQALQRDTIIQTAADGRDVRRKIDCPHCHQPMDAHFYAGPGNVVIDSCDRCELNWLDHGELTRIAHAPDSHNPATFVATASSYGDDTSGSADGPYDPALQEQSWSNPSNASGGSGAPLLDAVASLFRR